MRTNTFHYESRFPPIICCLRSILPASSDAGSQRGGEVDAGQQRRPAGYPEREEITPIMSEAPRYTPPRLGSRQGLHGGGSERLFVFPGALAPVGSGATGQKMARFTPCGVVRLSEGARRSGEGRPERLARMTKQQCCHDFSFVHGSSQFYAMTFRPGTAFAMNVLMFRMASERHAPPSASVRLNCITPSFW